MFTNFNEAEQKVRYPRTDVFLPV